MRALVLMAIILLALPFTERGTSSAPASEIIVGLTSGVRVDLSELGKVAREDGRLHQALLLSSAPLETIRAYPGVRYAEANAAAVLALGAGQPDPLFPLQEAYPQVRAAPSWISNETVVCVLDTGVNAAHEDLHGLRLAAARNLLNPSGVDDDNGHGTAVVGILAATSDNGVGIRGLANVSIAVGKVLDASGTGTFDALAQGIAWCADLPVSH